MKTIFLDTNIFISHFQNKNPGDKNIKAFEKIISSQQYKLVGSPYIIAELAKVEKLEEKTIDLVKWIDDQKPLWIHDRLFLHQEELKRFIFDKHFKCSYDVKPFTEYLSHCLFELNNLYEPQNNFKSLHPGITAFDLLQIYHNHQDIIKTEAQRCTTDSETIRQHKKGKASDHLEKEIFCKWIETLLPNGDPFNNELKKKDISSLCYKNKKIFLNSCRSIAVEHYYSEYHRRDPKRNIKDSDAIDLPIICSAIFCDYFISDDKFLREFQRFENNLTLNTKISSFDDFLNDYKK